MHWPITEWIDWYQSTDEGPWERKRGWIAWQQPDGQLSGLGPYWCM